MYEGKIKGENLKGRPPVKFTHRMDIYCREKVAREKLNVLSGNRRMKKVGAFFMAA